MANDPFEGPGEAMAFLSDNPDPYRSRPEITAAYDGECFCGIEFYEGDAIRATADGAGWEAVDHGHDPEESMPVPLEVEQRVILQPHGPYDASTHPEEESMNDDAQAEIDQADMLMSELAAAEPEQFSCPCCPAVYAPTKNKRVRKHSPGGILCPGSGQAPVELREMTPLRVADVMDLPMELVDGLTPAQQEAEQRLDAALSPIAQAARERVATGPGPSPNPHRPKLGDPVSFLGPVPVDSVTVHDGAPCRHCGRWTVAEDEVCDPCNETVPQGVLPEYGAVHVTPGPVTANVAPRAERSPAVDAFAATLWLSRSQEPEPERDSYGRYLLPHPVTGKQQSWRRVTTFSGQLDDTYNLESWLRRHLLRGAAQNPELARQAARLEISRENTRDKQTLNEMADELMVRSGSKTAADEGTYVHTLTEAVDRSTDADSRNAAFAAVPANYRADVIAYGRALDRIGLKVVPALLERRTVVTEYGTAGTFDQVCMAVRDIPEAGLAKGDFVVTDKKTGSDVSYGAGTHAVQLSQYAHGINSSGVWDEFARQWTHPVRVREDVGVIVHLPLETGQCTLHVLDLTKGWAACSIVQAVYDWRSTVKSRRTKLSRQIGTTTVVEKEAPVSAPVQPPTPVAEALPPEPTGVGWTARVQGATTLELARQVHADAVAARMPDGLLGQLTEAVQRTLSAAAPVPVTGPDVMSAGYWIPQAMQVTDLDGARGLHAAMVAAGVGEDVKAVIVQRVRDWLESQAQTTAVMTPPAVSTWESQAVAITSREEAAEVYGRAQQDPDMTEDRLKELVRVMQNNLTPDPPF